MSCLIRIQNKNSKKKDWYPKRKKNLCKDYALCKRNWIIWSVRPWTQIEKRYIKNEKKRVKLKEKKISQKKKNQIFKYEFELQETDILQKLNKKFQITKDDQMQYFKIQLIWTETSEEIMI